MIRGGTKRRRYPVPPPPGHSFNKPDDPPQLATELRRLRHLEWKLTSVGAGAKAASTAEIRLALFRGFEAGQAADHLLTPTPKGAA